MDIESTELMLQIILEQDLKVTEVLTQYVVHNLYGRVWYNVEKNVSDNKREEVESKAEEIKKNGIKHKDACHVACAIIAGADYFLSTDYRLLKYKTDEIIMMNPTDFIKEMEAD